MGTGKSTVGKILAKRLNRPLVDIDQRIEEEQKKKIADIFEKEGEAVFRCLEKEMIRQVAEAPGQVVTTGGGLLSHAAITTRELLCYDSHKVSEDNRLIIRRETLGRQLVVDERDGNHA